MSVRGPVHDPPKGAALEPARGVALVAETWLPFSDTVRNCGPIEIRLALDGPLVGRELASSLDEGLERTLASARREAARMGANRVIGFEVDVDPFGSRIEFSAHGVAVSAVREGPRTKREEVS